MDKQSPSRTRKQYRVQVGHANVVVQGESIDDAIRQARKQLCDEMPRLWDVIHRLEDRQFRVDPAHE